MTFSVLAFCRCERLFARPLANARTSPLRPMRATTCTGCWSQRAQRRGTSTDPGEALAEVSEVLCEDNPLMTFVTMWFGIFDPADGTVTYANAVLFGAGPGAADAAWTVRLVTEAVREFSSGHLPSDDFTCMVLSRRGEWRERRRWSNCVAHRLPECPQVVLDVSRPAELFTDGACRRDKCHRQSNDDSNISFNSEKSTGLTTKACAPRSRASSMRCGSP